MQPRQIFLALLVVAVWGFNFVFIHMGLEGLSPVWFCAIRFFLTAFPAVFFLPRPKTSWPLLAAFGFFNFAIQFSCLFVGMHLGMPAGLASLVAQFQAFFTMGLAIIFFREKPSAWKISGALISLTGILLVAVRFQGSASFAGLIFTLCGALAWAFGNMFSKKINAASPLALVVWGGLIACPCVCLLALFLEGPAALGDSLQHFSAATLIAVAYNVYLSTLLAYSLWGYLLNKVHSAVIAPFSLLVPVFGFLGAALALGEDFPAWKIYASLFVIAGLAFNVFEAKIKRVRRALPF